MYEVHSTLILSYDTVRHCLRHGQIIGQASLLHANKDIITVDWAFSVGRCKSPSLYYVGGISYITSYIPPTIVLVDTIMPVQCVHEHSTSNPTSIPYCLQETGKESGNTTSGSHIFPVCDGGLSFHASPIHVPSVCYSVSHQFT